MVRPSVPSWLPLAVVVIAAAILSGGQRSWVVGAEVEPEVLALFSASVYRSADGETLPYRLMAPAGLSESGGQPTAYPLVLFLHGSGERGDDNVSQLVHAAREFARQDRRQDFPAFVLFPQCPQDQRWVESDWELASGRDQFPQQPSTPMRLVLELVDRLVSELPVDPRRVYVTGLSMGGMGSWYAAGASPDRFAAMLEVCGGGDPSWAERYSGVPVWAFHGQSDAVVPVSRGREMIKALVEVGHHPEIHYEEYPGVGHDSWTRTYARDDVFQWLFSQRKP
jgi:predicted peptidase